MEQSINDKYILCSKCGQIGRGLLKIDDIYVCAEKDLCKNRTRRKAKLKSLCSVWYCTAKGKDLCSCGITLCKDHIKGGAHKKHVMEPL